jgi:ABC-2 type transport system ATP-binding protein
VRGNALAAVLDAAEAGGWMAVPFGTSLHVSSAARDDFPAWLAAQGAGLTRGATIEPVRTGLEDVFIALTQNADGNVR